MVHTLKLNGVWKARWTDGQRGKLTYAEADSDDPVRYIDAQVPGEIHLDLMRAGTIADVYEGLGVLQARWVEEFIWSYRREFDPPQQALSSRCWLYFERLDLAATVVLNGTEVGRHCNSFYPCRFDVTGKLRPGRNVLTVHVEGGLYETCDKPWTGYGNFIDGKLHKRHWQRKPQCQFGWDWSQRLINVGVTGEVRLEWSDAPARLDQLVPLVTVSDDLQTGRVNARLFVEGLQQNVAGTLTAWLEGTGIEVAAPVTIQRGMQALELGVELTGPRLWWPTGCGRQHRYTLRVRLDVAGETVGEASAKIGFRRVRVNQDPHPERGRFFVIEVNNRPVFCKGANFVPADMIFVRCDRERYGRLTDLALEANFNMLRVWGGGLYESDDFYDLCDEKGILVWQEFIFACSKYPAHDQAFNESVKSEARYNIRRLARYPSLVVWCGNNEIEQGYWDWGYDKGVVLPDYALYHLTLPRLMAEEDPTRYYQPSSPISPDGQKPTADHVGDQHPWALGFRDNDYRKYRPMTPRFPNEGGSLGPTALPTMLACLPEGQRSIQSFAWQIHDNSIDSSAQWSPTDAILDFHLGIDVRELTCEQFALLGGLVQGEALKEYCESFRARMFDSAAAIFWMYNDCWPAVRSWTVVDYYLRRTPAFWAVKRAMQPVHVILVERGDRVCVIGVNDTPEPVRGELRFGVFDTAGGYPLDQTILATLAPNARTELGGFSRAAWRDPASSLAFAVLSGGGAIVARNRLVLPLLKELAWYRPRVQVQLHDGQAEFRCDVFAWGVCLDQSGELSLADNLFDLYPGLPHRIPWEHARPPTVLQTGNDLLRHLRPMRPTAPPAEEVT